MGSAAPQRVGYSRTRDRTPVPCIGRQILDHWVTREVLGSHTLRTAAPDKAAQELLQILDSMAWGLKRCVYPESHLNSSLVFRSLGGDDQD